MTRTTTPPYESVVAEGRSPELAERPPLGKHELGIYIRRHVRANLYDESGRSSGHVALYGLSDPRDIRDVRYIGQTRAPASRFLQHVNTARLWLPDDLPWWIQSPRLRPLYGWIRQLYRQERRLPVMLVTSWAATSKEARLAERARIIECLTEGRKLYNVEQEILGCRLPLI